jgi:hypothetical protein
MLPLDFILLFFFNFFDIEFHYVAQAFCPNLQSAGITGVLHHAWFILFGELVILTWFKM